MTRGVDGPVQVIEWLTSYTFPTAEWPLAELDSDRVVEAHGSIHWMQCAVECGVGTFPADPYEVEVDEETMRAREPLPACPRCGKLARPNILMFGDRDWDDSCTAAQGVGVRQWLETLRGCRLVVVECGAGTAIPTIRLCCEDLAYRFHGTLVRVNPREPEVPDGHLSLPLGALKAIRAIEGWLRPGAGTPVGMTGPT